MSSGSNWAEFLMFYVTLNNLYWQGKNFIEGVCWFPGFTDTSLPICQAFCHFSSLTALLHIWAGLVCIPVCPPQLRDCLDQLKPLSLKPWKVTRNVSFQYGEKHSHCSSHAILTSTDPERIKVKTRHEFGMPAAWSSTSFPMVCGLRVPFPPPHSQTELPSW